MKRVLILGSTGSIGRQAIEVIAASDGLQVVGLSADSSWETLHRQGSVRVVRQPSPESLSAAWRDRTEGMFESIFS